MSLPGFFKLVSQQGALLPASHLKVEIVLHLNSDAQSILNRALPGYAPLLALGREL